MCRAREVFVSDSRAFAALARSMPRNSALRHAATSFVALALTACVHERSKSIGIVREGALAREDAPPVSESAPICAPCAPKAANSAPSVMESVDDRRIAVSDAAPAHRPIPAGESLEDRARTKFLSSTTEISADRATLYVPRAYAGEVSRQGTTVATLRRLTVRASLLTVVVRDENPDLQLSARGSVSFRSDQPASVIEETGLRSLLLKNDGYTPLR